MNTYLSNEILNVGLNFSMEFGKNWLQPINQRLLDKFSQLSSTELEECNNICIEINRIAHNFVFENPVKIKPELKFVDYSEFENFMMKNFDWINKENMKCLYSQSCYYAYK